MEGGVRAALADTTSAGSAGSAGSGGKFQKTICCVFSNDFGTSTLPIFGKKLYLVVFYDDFGTIAFPMFGNNMLLCFTMILVHLLVLFFIKSKRWPKAAQGAQSDPTGTPQVPQDGQEDRKEGEWDPKSV